MPVAPEVQMFLDGLAGTGGPATSELSPAEARAMYELLAHLDGEPDEVAAVEDTVAPGPAGHIPVRVYRPAADVAGPRPGGLLWFHGGGWVLGGLETAHRTCSRLAARSGSVVVSVAYRLAPEHPAPAALADCLATLRWVASGAVEGVDRDRLAVGGDSAGANLAALTALEVPGTLRHQLLLHPPTDLTGSHPSMTENAEGYLLTADTMEWFIRLYLGGEIERDDPRVSPFFADDLSSAPPATVVTAEYDPLRDDGEAYARRLEEAGVPVELRRFDGQIHNFFAFTGVTPEADEVLSWAADRLRAALR